LAFENKSRLYYTSPSVNTSFFIICGRVGIESSSLNWQDIAEAVLNYAIFLSLANKKLPSRVLLIFEEAHLLGTEIVRFRDLTSISFAHDVGPIGCSMPLISTQVVALQVE